MSCSPSNRAAIVEGPITNPLGVAISTVGSAATAAFRYASAATSSMSASRCRLRSGTSSRWRALTFALSREGDSVGRLAWVI